MKSLLLILLFIAQFVNGQNWHLKQSIPLEADSFIGVDFYDYIYWMKNNVLYKQEGDKSYSFSDKLLGNIQSVDLTNPLTLLVFYYQSQTMVVLDNNFNEIDRVLFSSFPEFMEVETIGNAGSRKLWIGNTASQRLELLDYKNKNLEALSQSFSGEILDQVSDYNYCYIRTDNNIYLYNNYGSVLQKLSATSYERMFPASKGAVLQKDDGWYYWSQNNSKPERMAIKLDGIDVRNLFYARQACYVFDGTQLHTYIAEN